MALLDHKEDEAHDFFLGRCGSLVISSRWDSSKEQWQPGFLTSTRWLGTMLRDPPSYLNQNPKVLPST